MNAFGVELELAVLLVLQTVGHSVFDTFEVETPAWRKILKWTIVTLLTLGIYSVAGHWALLLPLVAGALGVTYHFIWCRKNGVDPLNATPRRRYYELRGWEWRE